MRWSLVFFIFSVPALSSTGHFKIDDCESFVKNAWTDIISQEPRIQAALEDIARASGTTAGVVKMTNCWAKFPVDEEGEPISGLRVAVLDKVWFTENGKSKSHGGIKIVYNLKKTVTEYSNGDRLIRTVRNVRGFSVCRTSAVCELLDIPMKEVANPPNKEEYPVPIAPVPGEGFSGPSSKNSL